MSKSPPPPSRHTGPSAATLVSRVLSGSVTPTAAQKHGSFSRVTLTMQRVGIWITPDICTLLSSWSAPMFGASAFMSSSSRIIQPTDAQVMMPEASKDDRKDQDGIGCALSCHSIMTRGHDVPRLLMPHCMADARTWVKEITPSNKLSIAWLIADGEIRHR